jgi:cytochrome c553
MRFLLKSGAWAAALSGGVLVYWSAFAQEPVRGDAERGEALAYTCLGCHGVPNYKNAYPNYRVPKLSGQYPEYLVIALQAYKNGERSHATMHSQAASLSDRDMADIAAFFSSAPIKSDSRPEGRAPPAVQTCVACHGQDGVGIMPQYPIIAGQHADYLARALTDYKRGGRKNPIMVGFAGQLTPEEIDALAEYYARQKPALATVQGAVSVLSSGP